ncbi:uncharacterized protein [Lolium perenne]|uniref:uncharacterized protein isoform X3 n=1 Tax=Lolium perenne TaxID=4522 RepID=UPI003A99FC86
MILAPAPDRVLLLLRLFAMWLGADCDEPSHDAIVPIPRRGPALYPAVGALEDRNIARDHDNQGLIVDNQRFVSSIADQTTHLAATSLLMDGEDSSHRLAPDVLFLIFKYKKHKCSMLLAAWTIASCSIRSNQIG